MPNEIGPERVLITCDTVGGVWGYALELAGALGEHGVEVLLASLGGRATPAQRAEALTLPNVLLAESDYRLEWMEDPWQDVAASGRWLLALEDRYRPDVVHLNTYGHGTLSWSAPVILTAHSCVLSWWASVHRSAAPERWYRYGREVRSSLRAVDLLVAPSQAMLRMVERQYGPDLPPGRVVYNGRNPERYRRSAKEPFVLTAGRLWDAGKNVAAVARAAARLPWPCYLAGECRPPDGAAAEFSGCRMLGKLASGELADWYARASIYALPARYEPFGLTALEAALSGCALVLGDIESLREIWRDAAVFVPPDDDGALARALGDLIGRQDLRERMSRLAFERAREFTPRRMAGGYLEAYRSLGLPRRQACAS